MLLLCLLLFSSLMVLSSPQPEDLGWKLIFSDTMLTSSPSEPFVAAASPEVGDQTFRPPPYSSDIPSLVLSFCTETLRTPDTSACLNGVWQAYAEKELMLPENRPDLWSSLMSAAKITRSNSWWELSATWLPSTILPHLSLLDRRNVLEVGSFEGGSTTWFMRHFLAHEESRLTVVDTWQDTRDPECYGDEDYSTGNFDTVLQRFLSNVRNSPNSEKVRAIRGDSASALASLLPTASSSFDFIYVDGSHRASEVFLDVSLSFRLLKRGGIMLLDDYKWVGERQSGQRPSDARVEGGCGAISQMAELDITAAIDSVLASVPGGVEVLHCGYQLMVRKLRESVDVKAPEKLII